MSRYERGQLAEAGGRLLRGAGFSLAGSLPCSVVAVRLVVERERRACEAELAGWQDCSACTDGDCARCEWRAWCRWRDLLAPDAPMPDVCRCDFLDHDRSLADRTHRPQEDA